MGDIEPISFGDHELFLQGRLQFQTVVDALKLTGFNRRIERKLKTYLKVDGQHDEGNNGTCLSLYMSGDSVVQVKADIVDSLCVMELSPNSLSDARVAARGLLDILGGVEEAEL